MFSACLTETEEHFPDEVYGYSCVIGSEIYLDVSYLHYLYDARLGVSSCMQACRVWSAPYDGEEPPPEEYQPSTLDEVGVRGRQPQHVPKRLPQQARPPHPTTEPPSSNQQELEWDDSYDACPVVSPDPAEFRPPQPPAGEPPQHIQEMRRNAIMLVKGSYIEESDFQNDVMVYDLVAKKDIEDVVDGGQPTVETEDAEACLDGNPEEHGASQSNLQQKEATLKNGISPSLRSSTGDDTIGPDAKVKGQSEQNTYLQSAGHAEACDDLASQYEELIRTLDGGVVKESPVKTDAEFQNAVTAMEEEEVDFSTFSEDTPEPEKITSPFGTKQRSGSRSHSAPFTGKTGGNVRYCENVIQHSEITRIRLQ